MMTPLDRKVAPVSSVLGRQGRVSSVAGDYGASKVAHQFPTIRSDGTTRANVRDCVSQLYNGTPTLGTATGRGIHDDFVSGYYVVGTVLSLASGTGFGPDNSASSHLSLGLVRWTPDTTGTLLYDAGAEGCGNWVIRSGASTGGGGVLWVPPHASWKAASKYAVRMTAKFTIAATLSPTFIGLVDSSSLGSVASVLNNRVSGFYLPGTSTGGRHDIYLHTPNTTPLGAGAPILRAGAPTAVKTFSVAVTYNPTRGTHLAMWSADPADDIEYANATASGVPLAFAIATKTAPSTFYAMLTVDYVGYSLVDLG